MSTSSAAQASKLRRLALLSFTLGFVCYPLSVLTSSDGLGRELLLNCHRPTYARRAEVSFNLRALPLEYAWCLLTNVVKGFVETPFSLGVSVSCYWNELKHARTFTLSPCAGLLPRPLPRRSDVGLPRAHDEHPWTPLQPGTADDRHAYVQLANPRLSGHHDDVLDPRPGAERCGRSAGQNDAQAGHEA